jgi:peptidoglycan hydrolase-like protein with peptidoglycan-binding domain
VILQQESTTQRLDDMDIRGRRRALAIVVGGSVLAGGLGFAAASWVKSPQEAAAEHASPEPSILRAAVEERVLTDTVVVRGQVAVAGTFSVSPALSAEGRPLVTGVRKAAGDEVASGEVLLEIAGRPVIVLEGRVPAYRDLRPGAEGDDVAQLQTALDELGFSTGPDRAGVFGAGTKSTVDKLYESIGFATPTTGDDDVVAGAADAVKASDRAVDQAKRALSRLQRDAAAAHEAAERCDDAKAASAPDPDVGDEPEECLDIPVAPDGDAIEDAQLQVQQAEEDLADAQRAYSDAAAASGPMLPLGEHVFVPSVPARVHEVHVAVGDEAGTDIATLTSGSVVVRTRVDSSTRELLDEDMPVEIFSERLDLKVAGVIDSIGEFTDDTELGPGHTVTVKPAQGLDTDLVGQDVRLTVAAASTSEPVLVVPLSAVSASADGTTIVVRLDADGTHQRVVVTAGVSGDGFVEVTPDEPAELSAGDEVVVGAG